MDSNKNNQECTDRFIEAMKHDWACARVYSEKNQDSCSQWIWKHCSRRWSGTDRLIMSRPCARACQNVSDVEKAGGDTAVCISCLSPSGCKNRCDYCKSLHKKKRKTADACIACKLCQSQHKLNNFGRLRRAARESPEVCVKAFFSKKKSGAAQRIWNLCSSRHPGENLHRLDHFSNKCRRACKKWMKAPKPEPEKIEIPHNTILETAENFNVRYQIDKFLTGDTTVNREHKRQLCQACRLEETCYLAKVNCSICKKKKGRERKKCMSDKPCKTWKYCKKYHKSQFADMSPWCLKTCDDAMAKSKNTEATSQQLQKACRACLVPKNCQQQCNECAQKKRDGDDQADGSIVCQACLHCREQLGERLATP